jgi:NDP-sugar pyrophosphorylase family protein
VKAIILAAGEGTRLRPLTRDVPKPMLPLAGEPLIGHLVGLLRAHGVGEIAVNLHHKPEAIPAYLGDGSRFGVSITYSREETLLGSAGAVKKLEPFFDESLFVLYGDVLTDIDLAALAACHRQRGGTLTMALHETDEPSRCGIAETGDNGMVRRFREKPTQREVFSSWANAGIYAVEPSILRFIPENSFFDFGNHLIPLLLERGEPVGAYLSDSYFLDIGSVERYEQAERDLTGGAVRAAGPSFVSEAGITRECNGDNEDAACTSPRENQFRRRRHRSGRVLRVLRRDGS